MLEWSFIEEEQKMVCESLGVAWNPIETHSLIAFNESLFTSIKPINGLRHPKQAVIDGWYLWGGSEIPDDEHYFWANQDGALPGHDRCVSGADFQSEPLGLLHPKVRRVLRRCG